MNTKNRVLCVLAAGLMTLASAGCLRDDTSETDAPETNPPRPVVTEPDETDAPETDENVPGIVDIDSRIYSYVSGKTVTEEERNRRPVAIMINNIINSLPQVGIGYGDLYYECSAEGGITRIMMLTDDYDALGTIGSIRSSRDYFVDLTYTHDAIYVHAGGSPQAYEKLIKQGVNNLDGVTMYLPDTFWRDNNRMYTLGYEHSLMTSGEAIAASVSDMDYRTTIDGDYSAPFRFYDENTDNKPGGDKAEHLHMQSTAVQTVDFVYDADTGEYLRYQYNGMAQIDGATGEQLSLKNVIVIFTDISLIPGDTSGRLSVVTTGGGNGYYLTNGVKRDIKWSRDGALSGMKFEYADGEELILNCGKTFICIVDDSVDSSVDFNYKW